MQTIIYSLAALSFFIFLGQIAARQRQRKLSAFKAQEREAETVPIELDGEGIALSNIVAGSRVIVVCKTLQLQKFIPKYSNVSDITINKVSDTCVFIQFPLFRIEAGELFYTPPTPMLISEFEKEFKIIEILSNGQE